MPGARQGGHPWWTLAGACIGLFLLMLDSTVVNLALPAMQGELGATSAELQWVINGYLLTIAALVVTASRLGDIFGRRNTFVVGSTIFAAGSVISGAALSPEMLIAGRVAQGLGAAAMLGLSLALVSHAFPADEQARALGIWAGVSAIALGIGPLAGGVLVDLDWRVIFWINPPLALAGVAIILWSTPESRDETASRRVDRVGLVVLSAALVALILPLVQAQAWGWGSPATIGLLAAAVVLGAAFWAIEHRVESPIVDFSLFRNGPYFGASAAAFALVGAWWALMFFQAQYLQNILGHSPVAAGALILPVTLPMVVISPLAGRLIARFGTRRLMTAGMACGLAGVVILTRISEDSGYGLLAPGYLLFGIALGLVYAPMSTAAMAAMPRAKAGIASGVLAMDRVLAGAVALAATGAIFQALQRSKLTDLLRERGTGLHRDDAAELEGLLAGADRAQERLAGQPEATQQAILDAVRETYAFAVSNAFWALVGLLVVGTALTWLFVRDPAPRPEEAVEALEESAEARVAAEAPSKPLAPQHRDAALPPGAAAGELHHYWHHRRFHL